MLPAGNEYNCYRQICISQVGQRAFEWNYLHLIVLDLDRDFGVGFYSPD